MDEGSIRDAMLSEKASPRDIADCLAELKAQKISAKNPSSLVIGCDQTLDLKGQLLSKPASPAEARNQLKMLRGNKHKLLSAVVICEGGRPIWRHIGVVEMQMREFTDKYLDEYIDRNWESIRWSVGAYKLEEEGVRLFSKITGDYFTVLGLPLLEVLSYLSLRGVVSS